MKFLDTKYFGVKLSPNRIKNDKGQLIVLGCTFARTGKQRYHRSELELEGDGFIDIDRPVEEVSSPATIASFEGAPLTYDHPEDDVKVGVNWNQLAKGMATNVKYVSDSSVSGCLVADLIFTDPKIIDDVENNRIKELSAGYNCEVDEDNWVQRKIRGNHIAIVESARAGHMATIRDKAYSLKDNKAELEKYLDWEGIYGYTEDIMEKATEGYDSLDDFLEYEGILGYTDTIYGIAVGRMKAPIHDKKVKDNRNIKDKRLDIPSILKKEILALGGASRRADYNKVISSIKADTHYPHIYNVFPSWGLTLGERNRLANNLSKYEELELNLGIYFIVGLKEDLKHDVEDKKVKDKLVDVPADMLNEIKDKIKELGFNIDKEGRTILGRIHLQILSIEGGHDEESLHNLAEELEDITNFYRKEFNIPITYNIGLQYDGYISAGVDVDKMWIEDNKKKTIDSKVVKKTKDGTINYKHSKNDMPSYGVDLREIYMDEDEGYDPDMFEQAQSLVEDVNEKIQAKGYELVEDYYGDEVKLTVDPGHYRGFTLNIDADADTPKELLNYAYGLMKEIAEELGLVRMKFGGWTGPVYLDDSKNTKQKKIKKTKDSKPLFEYRVEYYWDSGDRPLRKNIETEYVKASSDAEAKRIVIDRHWKDFGKIVVTSVFKKKEIKTKAKDSKTKTVKVGDKVYKISDSYTYKIENPLGNEETYVDYYAYNDEGIEEVVKTVRVKDAEEKDNKADLQKVKDLLDKLHYTGVTIEKLGKLSKGELATITRECKKVIKILKDPIGNLSSPGPSLTQYNEAFKTIDRTIGI